jgi:8-oxo-dGTP pyrophosphatase MutT (NUDIX family)
MMREFSAGGIVFKKQKTKNKKQKTDNLLWLVAQHSQHKGWVFPKGLIGDHKNGETSEETAVREVEEETGVKARIVGKVKNPATYFYTWQGEKRFKTVYYFLMEYVSGDIKNHDFEMSDVVWVPTDEVLDKLTYKSDKKAFGEAFQLLEKYE